MPTDSPTTASPRIAVSDRRSARRLVTFLVLAFACASTVLNEFGVIAIDVFRSDSRLIVSGLTANCPTQSELGELRETVKAFVEPSVSGPTNPQISDAVQRHLDAWRASHPEISRSTPSLEVSSNVTYGEIWMPIWRSIESTTCVSFEKRSNESLAHDYLVGTCRVELSHRTLGPRCTAREVDAIGKVIANKAIQFVVSSRAPQ